MEDKTDKFIMISLGDERAKKISEVLGNATCKKILDYLAETKEASENDISKDLKIPLNTVEYNLKKLISVGLVEKTKNHFWSQKGKKIPTYKAAKKHIIISPKSNPKINMNALKTIIPIFAAIALVALFIAYSGILNPNNNPVTNNYNLKSFSSYNELEKFLQDNQDKINSGFYGGIGVREENFATADGSVRKDGSNQAPSIASAEDYSTTNIQVQGVDEPDIIKNDGKYIYTITQGKVVIVEAYPAENMKILSELNISGARNLFINGDKLIVLLDSYSYGYYAETSGIASSAYFPDTAKSSVYIYNIQDKNNPVLEDKFSIGGYYNDARMIDNYVYLISTEYVNYDNPRPMPYEVNGISKEISASEIGYFDYNDYGYTFTNIASINLDNNKFNNKVFLTGSSNVIYVSQNNIYLTYTKYIDSSFYLEEVMEKVIAPLLPSKERNEVNDIISDNDKEPYEKWYEVSQIVQDYSISLTGKEKSDFDNALLEAMNDFNKEKQKELQKTIIHKIEIDDGEINYITAGEVPGMLLNQFSLDEYKENLRVTTTTQGSGFFGVSNVESLNHLYVLDDELEIIGSIENLAEGERIYSTRFIEDRAYMVTFRQIDPLYVIDLSNPKNPEVLGFLKVTGYSSYLHPYDENHIIGVGQEATEEGRVQGVKIAIFDVSDVSNPIEKVKYEVKEQWSHSDALYDHKAFLFDKDKELLVLPMSYQTEKPGINQYGYKEYEYWQGAFVFKINLNEITLEKKITHFEEQDETEYYRWNWIYNVQRSLFMDNVLYTISQGLIKANDLSNNINDINQLELPINKDYNDYPIIFDNGGIAVAEPGVMVK